MGSETADHDVVLVFSDRRADGEHTSERIRRRAESANDLLATTGAGYLSFVEAVGPPGWAQRVGRRGLDDGVDRMYDNPRTALALTGSDDPTRTPNARRLADRFTSAAGDSYQPTTVTVRVAALNEIGGFDPSFPGFGWADVVQRLVDAGWAVDGLEPDDLPFVPDLYAGLGLDGLFRSEARWLQHHGAGGRSGSPKRFARYRRQVLAACLLARRASPHPELDRIRRAAAEGWPRPRPHEAQHGVGQRADWRFLLGSPGGEPGTTGDAAARSHTLILGRGPQERWRWLIDDGWTDRVTTTLDPAVQADVVVAGAADTTEPSDAAKVVAPGGVLFWEQPVSAMSRLRDGTGKAVMARLARAGLTDLRRYLVLPDLDRPKRYVPLDDPGGLDWLLATTPPPVAGALSGRHRTRRRLARAAGAGIARAGGGVAIVARRPEEAERPHRFAVAGLPPDRFPPSTSDVVLITSGHDAGSRAVLLPLVEPSADGLRSVIKISARPGYNNNVDNEVNVINGLRRRIEASGEPVGGLLPEVGEPFDVGRLRASTESYAGRWTAADVLNEQVELSDQVGVLSGVFAATTRLALATRSGVHRWSMASFEHYLGRWFDQLDDAVGPSPTLRALREDLEARSMDLAAVDATVPLTARHHDLGPWNVLFVDRTGDNRAQGGSPITIIDWESAPPRSPDEPGLAGADHLYFAKYWLHLAMGTTSTDDELNAFAFLADRTSTNDPRAAAATAIGRMMSNLAIDPGFVPLITTHVWLESACYTMARRQGNDPGLSGEEQMAQPGSAYPYLHGLARHRRRFLARWPVWASG